MKDQQALARVQSEWEGGHHSRRLDATRGRIDKDYDVSQHNTMLPKDYDMTQHNTMLPKDLDVTRIKSNKDNDVTQCDASKIFM